MSSIGDDLHQRARRAILGYAIFRWENAIVIATTILLTAFLPRPFPWWPKWGWPLLGLVGVASLISSSVTNQERNARLVLELLRDEIDLSKVQSPQLRSEVENALRYQERVHQFAREHQASVWGDRATSLASQMNDWVANVYRLALRLDAYQRDEMLAKEQKSLPAEIDDIEARLSQAEDEALKIQLEEVKEAKRKQLDTLNALERRMTQAQLQLDQTVSAVGTLDGQMRLLEARDVESGRSQRLLEDLEDQIGRLGDILASVNEVYNYQQGGLPQEQPDLSAPVSD